MIFQKALFPDHFWITLPADSSVPTKVLSTDRTFLIFSFIFFLLLLTIRMMGFCSERGFFGGFFLKFLQCILQKLTKMLLRQFCLGNTRRTLEKTQISLDKNLDNYRVPRQISRTPFNTMELCV